MKLIQLTRGFSTMVDDSDYEELSKYKWHYTNIKGIGYAVRGSRLPSIGYKQNGKVIRISMHRIITGATERSQQVDHIDGNGLNNQRENLRICTHSENLLNSWKHRIDIETNNEVTMEITKQVKLLFEEKGVAKLWFCKKNNISYYTLCARLEKNNWKKAEIAVLKQLKIVE
jgi:hypothetical protein